MSIFILMGCSSTKVQVFEDFSDVNIIWPEYERATYDLVLNNELSSEYETTIKKVLDGNRNVYTVDTIISNDSGMNMQGAVLSTYLDPISSYNKQIINGPNSSRSGEIIGYYEEDSLEIEMIYGEEYRSETVELPDNTIDNEYSLMLVRNFPLSYGYSRNLNMAVIAAEKVVPYSITVEGIEKVKVPYGEIECYKVVWKHIGRGLVPNIYSWYSTENDKKMVKYVNENIELHLRDYSSENSQS